MEKVAGNMAALQPLNDLQLNTPQHFLKKPLFVWTKSFASENELRREDSFSKFLSSDAFSLALEFIGIGSGVSNDGDQSLHLSSIFDEEGLISNTSGSGSTWNSLSSSLSTSSRSQPQQQRYSPTTHQSLELKQRMLNLQRIYNDFCIYYEHNFNQILLFKPPNSLHSASPCDRCGIEEFQKFLLLLLGAGVQGNQKQEAIRRIRDLPTSIQEQLVESIKQMTHHPEILSFKPWTEISELTNEEQRTIYEKLISHIRQLINERNDIIHGQHLLDYSFGLLNCDQRHEHELRTCESLDYDKISDEGRSKSLTMRQLREEIVEKSDLLKECREELEISKTKLQDLQIELAETQCQLRALKKTRDEVDVLREGKEKAIRLEAELSKLRNKLDEAEQYYDRIEILESSNRTYQRKVALLMDQINMLTIEKERLEISFLTQQNYRIPQHPKSDSEDEIRRILASTPRKIETTYEDELILDSDPEAVDTTINTSQQKEVQNIEVEKPAIPTQVSVSTSTNELIEEKENAEPLGSQFPKFKDAGTQNEIAEFDEKPCQVPLPTIIPTAGREKSRGSSKRGRRKNGWYYAKRTRKLIIAPSSSRALQPKYQVLLAPEHLVTKVDRENRNEDNMRPQYHQVNSSESSGQEQRRGQRRRHRTNDSVHRRVRSPEPPDAHSPNQYPHNNHPRHLRMLSKRIVPPGHESDADEELSISPYPSFMNSNFRENRFQTDFVPAHHNSRSSRMNEPLQMYDHLGGEDGDDEEFFFVCSTVSQPQPPMARNIRIYAPSSGISYLNHPINQEHAERSVDDEYELGSPINPPHVRQRFIDSPKESVGPYGSHSPVPSNTRCSIQLNLRQVNAHSHQFSLLDPEHESYVEENLLRPTSKPSQPHQVSFHADQLSNTGHHQTSNHRGNHPTNLPKDYDDSCWFEYGCV